MSGSAMNRHQAVILAATAALIGAGVWWWTARVPSVPDPPAAVGPSRTNFDRVREGMTLAEVEALLGPAGPNRSEDFQFEHYIWKGPEGWVRAWVVDGTVRALTFDPRPPADD